MAYAVLTGSDDNTAIFWDAHSGQPLSILRGHQKRIWSVATQFGWAKRGHRIG